MEASLSKTSGGKLCAIAIDSGEVDWTSEISGIDSSPTVVDGMIFTGGGGGVLSSVLNADTGEEIWTFENDSGNGSSPTVVNNTVFVGGTNNMYALNVDTGEVVWTAIVGDDLSVYASPTVVDGTLFIGNNDGKLYALDAGVEGSSEGSRVRLGTLGHHENLDQSMTIGNSGKEAKAETKGEDSTPGFSIGTGIASVGSAAYALRQRLEHNE